MGEMFRTLYNIVHSLLLTATDIWAWLSTPINILGIGTFEPIYLLSGAGILILLTWWIIKGVFL